MNYDDVEILFAEDSLDDAMLTIRALTKSGFTNKLLHVKDGAEALDFIYCRGIYAKRNPKMHPKLFLLDLKMPKVSGMQVLEKGSMKSYPHRISFKMNEAETDWERPVEVKYNHGGKDYVMSLAWSKAKTECADGKAK